MTDESGGNDVDEADGHPEIGDWRRRMDAIDGQLLRLLNSRSACAVEIGRQKRRRGLPIYSPERESQILARLCLDNPGPLSAGALHRVFERIIDESRRLERLAAEAPQSTDDALPVGTLKESETC